MNLKINQATSRFLVDAGLFTRVDTKYNIDSGANQEIYRGFYWCFRYCFVYLYIRLHLTKLQKNFLKKCYNNMAVDGNREIVL